jgi:hypothetical protein
MISFSTPELAVQYTKRTWPLDGLIEPKTGCTSIA